MIISGFMFLFGCTGRAAGLKGSSKYGEMVRGGVKRLLSSFNSSLTLAMYSSFAFLLQVLKAVFLPSFFGRIKMPLPKKTSKTPQN